MIEPLRQTISEEIRKSRFVVGTKVYVVYEPEPGKTVGWRHYGKITHVEGSNYKVEFSHKTTIDKRRHRPSEVKSDTFVLEEMRFA